MEGSMNWAAAHSMSLLDRAFSYIDGVDNQVWKEKLFQALSVLRTAYGYPRSLFGAAEPRRREFMDVVSRLEDAIDDVECRKLEEVRNPAFRNFSKLLFMPFVVRHTAILETAVREFEDVVLRLKHEVPSYQSRYHFESFDRYGNHKVLFGRDREQQQIVQWLIQEEPQPVIRSHPVSIFAIVGIAGMGKTELARLAYGDSRVRMNFDSFAWVSLSGNFRAQAVTRVIVESIYNKILLVLDDAWEDNNLEEWKSLADSLKDCKPGSRILLTTQMQSVADIAEESIGAEVECLKLGELDEFNNLELLKSCLHSSGHPADLELIAEQIAKQIDGCPLVTIRVASQLNRMDPKHWYSVLKGSWRYEMGMNFLFTSYNRLPTELQNCFRYCSIFPKGHRFDKLELVNMWIGSGLIPLSSLGKNDVDLGEQYFAALAKKSFFCSMLETESSNGDQKEYYVLHSLMHDLAQFVSRGECARVDNDDFRNVMPTTRHLSVVHCGSLNQIPPLENLRTLIIQSESYLDEEAEYALQDVLMMSVRLRLLYLYVPSLSHALHELGTLTHLRYLFLFSCDRSLISLVHRLYHLKVLKINYFTDKEEYFSCIHNLRSLHCLHIPENIMLSKILNIRMLTRLQQLHVFGIAENDGQRLMALRNLTALRQLSLRNLQNVKNSKESEAIKIKGKQHMRFLSLSWNQYLNDPENLDHRIIDSLEPNKEIEQLHIHGYSGVQPPIWIENSSLIHLVSLELECCMNWKTMPSFQKLSSLKYLKLEHLLQLECIGTVTREQFQSNEPENVLPPFLNTLIIRWCPSLKNLPAIPCTLQQLIVKHVGFAVLPMIHQSYTGTCESSLPSSSVKSCLAVLHIECCEHLTTLDEGLLEQQQYLQSLETLVVRNCENLSHLPAMGLTELHHLTSVEIVACPMLGNGKTKCNLWPMSLKKLDINPCGHMEDSALMSLQDLTSLRSLTLFSCSNIEKLPSEEVFRTLKNLNDVSIARCKNLLSLGGLGAAPSLRVLSILCCDKIHHSYSEQSGCSFKLLKLKVDREAMLLVEPIRSLRYTMELHIGDDHAMESLPEEWLLQNASSLRLIEIGVAKNLQALPAQMEKLELLQSLHIERAPAIKVLPQLPASLNKLTIWGCDPRFLERYETNVGSVWVKIKDIAHVDMKAYSEDSSDDDDKIQYFDDSTTNPSRRFVVID
uniref:NB-ARC domain-containing protein n=1 Tax=Oryza meridionalis TaxID=40149 RepID=A0A0E0FCI2_9ORYZ